ncbi:SOUL heme-binding protein [Plesiocystis pacifica SIR-1]|uniref:SOUL heme-binding protein n=2 Tax=Plesiocystis pacifica TaxID=191768 RepID=A6GG12_9BACT|nr:SOUL heme-binding protein [Plesiocystis pacifica SIR-1]
MFMTRQEPLSRRAWVVASATAVTAGALATALPQRALARGRVETPAYEVIASFDAFEVRRYAPRLVAEVEVQGTGPAASNAGFRVLADFIFGNNSANTEVAMTAPVDRTAAARSEAIDMTAPVDRTQVADGEGKPKWVVAFTMPSKYTRDTLPTPNDPRVHIRVVPERVVAAVRFSGAPAEAAVQNKMAALVAAVDAEGLTRDGSEPTYARYDPPWTPGVLRRNEIMVGLRVPKG